MLCRLLATTAPCGLGRMGGGRGRRVVQAVLSTTTADLSSASSNSPLPPPEAETRPTDEERFDDPEYNSMKDGLAIKQATASFAGRRRFYKRVGIKEVAEVREGPSYEVTLDGYSLKTPGTEKPYRLPSKGLALAMALEWDQQVTYKGIEPTYMPITGIATIALDEIIWNKQQTIERCLRYLSTDTVCYFFPDSEEDRKLLRRQQKHWQPLLTWVKDEFGVEIAQPTHMLNPCENTEETMAKVARILREMDSFTLAATLSLVLDLKSVVTALALVFRYITVQEACEASSLEETHQKECWGHVDLHHELDEKVLYSQVSAASTFLWLLDEDRTKHKELKRRIKEVLRKEFPSSPTSTTSR